MKPGLQSETLYQTHGRGGRRERERERGKGERRWEWRKGGQKGELKVKKFFK